MTEATDYDPDLQVPERIPPLPLGVVRDPPRCRLLLQSTVAVTETDLKIFPIKPHYCPISLSRHRPLEDIAVTHTVWRFARTFKCIMIWQ
ncbi:hypothetical protein E2C01_002883 [Portunus trituberculatus]|uniref:Uncharacterized protein n=1 Tax=Portunus trituberculatus TaxID=210409 RepID=A0A5B7CN37_PORTR|nr:hypothetical protein [Portunus trituberculatus]